jgi:hypothetical protein
MAIKSLDKSSLVTPQTTNSMLAGYSFQDYELIESVFLASNASSITFNNLNQYATEYKHLQIRAAVRSDRSGVLNSGLFMRLNGDTGNNYGIHALIGTGSSLSSIASTSRSTTVALPLPAATATANAFGGAVIDILDAYSLTKNKTIRSLGGVSSSFNEIQLASGFWLNTASITSITFVTILSDQFVAGSRFSLYGIR